MPGRLPDPAPGAGDRVRRLQTEPLPRRVRTSADDDVLGPEPDAGVSSDVSSGTDAGGAPDPRTTPGPARAADAQPELRAASDGDPTRGTW